MSDPETPESGEPTEGGEQRTHESEIKANVEFWKDLGVEVDEADVRAKIEELPEVEGFDFYLYIPQGIKTSEIWQKMSGIFSVAKEEDVGDLDQMQEPRSNEGESYVVACHSRREPDSDSIPEEEKWVAGKSVIDHNSKTPEEWGEAGDSFLSPTEYFVACMRWQIESGKTLDQRYGTMFPGSKIQSNEVPIAHGNSAPDGALWLAYSIYPHTKLAAAYGIRRVITKDTKV
jgi:hypothetical protein